MSFQPPHDEFHHPNYNLQSIGPNVNPPFDSFKTPDYSQQSFQPGGQATVPLFDPLKPPPYELQTFDAEDVKATIRARNDSFSENDVKRGRGSRGSIRNESGGTGNRSLSRDWGHGQESTPGGSRFMDFTNTSSNVIGRHASMSPSRAMGARSGSISRVEYSTLDDQPHRGEELGVRRREGSRSSGVRSFSIGSDDNIREGWIGRKNQSVFEEEEDQHRGRR